MSAIIRLKFFRGTDFSSKMIEWFSAGPYSHVAAVWSETELLDSRSDKLGGILPGVEIRPAKLEVYSKPALELSLSVRSGQMMDWCEFLTRQLHRPYDKTAILGFAIGRDWRDPGSWMCSELQSAALERAGICPKLVTPSNRITPSALATIFSALGAKRASDQLG